MRDDQVEVFADTRPERAQMVRNALVDAGVEAFLGNEALQNAAGGLPLGWATAERVIVAAADESRAREIVREFEQEEQAAGAEQPTDVAVETETQVVSETCPECGRRRTAVCPICETASSDFPSAYAPPGETIDPEHAMLICTTCDEPFEARYLRRCEWCGHDYGSGIQAPPPVETAPIDQRVVALVMVLALAAIGVLAYFASLL